MRRRLRAHNGAARILTAPPFGTYSAPHAYRPLLAGFLFFRFFFVENICFLWSNAAERESNNTLIFVKSTKSKCYGTQSEFQRDNRPLFFFQRKRKSVAQSGANRKRLPDKRSSHQTHRTGLLGG